MSGWWKRFGLGAVTAPSVAQGGSTQQHAARVIEAGDFRVELDLSSQVLRLSAPAGALPEEIRPNAALSQLKLPGESFVSAVLLAQKRKQFDDGLYAALELALQEGAGAFRGKRWLLGEVARELAGVPAPSRSTVPGIVFGAGRLGGLGFATPPHLTPAVDSVLARFQADQTQSQPISFYNWSEDLRRIFLQDRMLQQELTGASEIGALAVALRRSGARAAYESYLRFTGRLTNPAPGDRPDLRGLLDDPAVAPPGQGLYFFPPSRAPETELVKKLFGNRPIPETFDLGNRLISALRAGSLDLQPGPDSGWYDFQTWAVVPLVLTEKMPESRHLELDRSYVGQLEEVFKTLLALARETHIKQLEIPPAAAARLAVPTFVLRPEISLEPVYSYFLRVAAGYRFLQQALEDQFGSEALARLHRLTPEGPVAQDLRSEFEEISALYYGASVTAGRELGFSEQERSDLEAAETSRLPGLGPGTAVLGSGRGATADSRRFQAWALRCDQDPDLARDSRTMVPLFYDVARRKTRVQVFLGWTTRWLDVEFARQPSTKVFDLRGRSADGKLQIEPGSRRYALMAPVTAELYVSRILDREEFRAHCDRNTPVEEILAHLSRD